MTWAALPALLVTMKLTLAACSFAVLVALGTALQAEEPQTKTDPQTGWSNTTDLGLTATSGNSDTNGLNLHNLLRWHSVRAGFRLKLDALLTNTADDPYRQVDPGFTWEPGAEPPPGISTTLVIPDEEPDTEKFLIDARYERSIAAKPRLTPGTMSWNIGTSWDRNLDAGILSRLAVYAGVGHVWWDREDLKFQSMYSLSWTNREEDTEDPEKDDQFPGIRYDWTYENRWAKNVVFHNEWTFNANLSDLSDFSSNMTSSIRVPMTQRLSLKVSLHWIYNNIPALQDIDLVARIVVVDPDGIPGSGDELFETVDNGGFPVELGSVEERKEKRDSVFATSLSISF